MKEKQRISPAMLLLLAAVALPLFYFLSSGPGLGLVQSGRVPRWSKTGDWLHAVYQPAMWLTEDTAFRQPMKDYVAWCEHALTPPPIPGTPLLIRRGIPVHSGP